MKCITDRNLKPIFTILCCCLYITITNCDDKLLEKRSVLGSNLERLPEKPELSQSEPIPVALASRNPDSNSLNVINNQTDSKIPTGKKSNSKNITSNASNATNINSTKVIPGKNITTTSQSTKKPAISTNFQPPINTGALLRGASVFLGLSVVVIAYIIFRCARLNKNRTQMVRKYGVLAHRQDVEMRPLPLDDEDEDDTTVFDASDIVAIHEKQRRST